MMTYNKYFSEEVTTTYLDGGVVYERTKPNLTNLLGQVEDYLLNGINKYAARLTDGFSATQTSKTEESDDTTTFSTYDLTIDLAFYSQDEELGLILSSTRQVKVPEVVTVTEVLSKQGACTKTETIDIQVIDLEELAQAIEDLESQEPQTIPSNLTR